MRSAITAADAYCDDDGASIVRADRVEGALPGAHLDVAGVGDSLVSVAGSWCKRLVHDARLLRHEHG